MTAKVYLRAEKRTFTAAEINFKSGWLLISKAEVKVYLKITGRLFTEETFERYESFCAKYGDGMCSTAGVIVLFSKIELPNDLDLEF